MPLERDAPNPRGYITQLLRAGVDVLVVSERCNVSPAIIDQHFDVRSEEDTMAQRRRILEEARNAPGGAY